MPVSLTYGSAARDVRSSLILEPSYGSEWTRHGGEPYRADSRVVGAGAAGWERVSGAIRLAAGETERSRGPVGGAVPLRSAQEHCFHPHFEAAALAGGITC